MTSDAFAPPSGVTVPPRESRQFVLPSIQDSIHGWGPSLVPDKYKDIPFAPFNKNDQLSRASDWQNTRNFRPRTQNFAGEGGFAYKHDEDDDSFNLVDNTPKFKPKDGRRRYKKFSVSNRRRRGRGFNSYMHNRNRGGKNSKQRDRQQRRRWGYQNYQTEQKPNSVLVQESWELVAEMPFKEFPRSAQPSEPQNLLTCGSLEKFERSFERLTPRQPISLHSFAKRDFVASTTSEDPHLQKLMEQKKANVYATDTILAVLMAAPKSVTPWDIVVRKAGDKIVLDKRPTSKMDLMRVNENWNEVFDVTKDDINHPDNLAAEATQLNQYFSQQCLTPGNPDAPRIELGESSFVTAEDKQPASMAYRYRKWTVGNHSVCARTSLNAYTHKKNGKKIYLNVRALNEFDPKHSGNVNWRQKLESQTGAVLATQMKNNANKLSRWTAELCLSGADEMRLGFISRSTAKDATKHQVLMTKKFNLSAFTTSLQIRPSTLWASLKHILSKLEGIEDGKYVLMKDANDTKLMLFSVDEDELLVDGDAHLN